jgi:hypothetical protein
VHQDVVGIGTGRCGEHPFARRPADASYDRALQKKNQDRKKTMDIKKKLQNPFALVAQGFVAGAILFWTTAPAEADANQVQGVEAAATAAQALDA